MGREAPPKAEVLGAIWRPIKTTLKRIVQGAFGGLWRTGFGILGRLSRPGQETWSSPGGRRILVVAPHPDDEVAGCAGAILAHRRCGDRVLISVATDGRRSRAFGLDGEQMAATRRAEMETCAAHLGVELDWIGLPEGEWRLRTLEARFGNLLRRFRPETIYAPSRIDFHPGHEKVARALARALAATDGEILETELRIYPVQVPLTPALANLVLAVDLATPSLKNAFRAHRTQLGSIERCLRHRRYAGRFYRAGGAAEEFWRLTPAQYRRLHSEAPARPLVRTFRGLRYYTWSDPLAYLRGLGERRRLARLVSEGRTGGALRDTAVRDTADGT